MWEPFCGAISGKGKRPLGWQLVDLWKEPASSFDAWAAAFCKATADYQRLDLPKPILLGYSLGGRLALHALLHQPELWQGAIIVAAHPGLHDETEKAARLEQDRHWAERFRTEPWDVLMRDWEAQAVFGGRPNPNPPRSGAFKRKQVASFFDQFSLSRQDNLRPALSRLTTPPVLYLTGEDDTKFTVLGRELAGRCPAITHEIMADAGHRVPWEAAEAFTGAVQDFIQSFCRIR